MVTLLLTRRMAARVVALMLALLFALTVLSEDARASRRDPAIGDRGESWLRVLDRR